MLDVDHADGTRGAGSGPRPWVARRRRHTCRRGAGCGVVVDEDEEGEDLGARTRSVAGVRRPGLSPCVTAPRIEAEDARGRMGLRGPT